MRPPYNEYQLRDLSSILDRQRRRESLRILIVALLAAGLFVWWVLS